MVGGSRGGEIDAKLLHAKTVTVNVSGSADVEVFATELLDVHISGSGKVRYHGAPKDVRKNISGSGSVEPL